MLGSHCRKDRILYRNLFPCGKLTSRWSKMYVCSVIQDHTKAPSVALAKMAVRPSMMSSKFCVCATSYWFSRKSMAFIMVQVAVGLLFFQLMSLGKFVDGDNDIFGHVFQLCIHSVSFLQKYGLFRGWPMFLFFFVLFMSVYGWLEG